MVTSFKHYNDVTDRPTARVQLFVFLSFPRAGTDVEPLNTNDRLFFSYINPYGTVQYNIC